ncbi:MAG: C25 family cysteine peptidase [Candidatus Tenebribacter burtonii]|nr:C25 family cysteine peptidase [Candidatus Tenebribacter burtonii]
MKKFLGLVMFLMFVCSISATDWIAFDSSFERELQVNIVESDDNSILLDINVPGMYLQNITENGQVYQRIKMIEGRTTHDVGFPELPMITRIIGIPDNKDVRVKVLNASTIKLNDYNIYPLQTPGKDDVSSNQEFVFDQEFYLSKETYPQDNTYIDNVGIWRDVKIGGFHFIPFNFDAGTKTLEVTTSARIEIEFDGFDDQHELNKDKKITPDFYNMYNSALINFSSMGYEIEYNREVNIKYLIVTNTTTLTSIQPFVDLKNQQGMPVEVRILETGFETAIQIKDYITQLYNSDDLEYVLMVGDAYPNGSSGPDNVPMYLWSGGGESSWSDSWYSCLDGNTDYYADIAIGRITYDNIAELDHQIQKLMDFYQTPDQTTNWGENSILVAHEQEYPLKYTQCKQQINDFPYALQTPIFTQCYGGAGATNNDIINWVNTTSGGIFNYRGHGSATELWQWGSTGSFTATHVNQLTNNNRNFVMFDVCCDNMDIVGYAGNCLAESFMKADEAAIAINGAIDPSYTIPNHDYDKEMYKAIFNEGILNIGYITNYANVFVVNLHGNIGIANVLTYLWLGDSSIKPWTLQIEELSVTHDNQLFLGISTFEVSVIGNGSPLENASVCVSNDDGTIYAYGFTDSNGYVEVQFDEPVQDPGTAYVTVTSHNFMTYQQDIPVIPLDGPYIIFESYVVDDTITGNGNGTLENGEIVDLDMSIENLGTEQGTDVIVTITTTDSYITVVDGTENFGNVAAESIVTVTGAFTIEAAGDMPDSHMIYFELEAVAEDTWISDFSLEAFAPMFPPENLTSEIQNYNDVMLTWEQPSGTDMTRDLLGYKIYKDGLEITEINDPAILTYTDAILPAGIYEYSITALFHVGESCSSNIETVTLVLPVPQNPEASTQYANILISWDELADRSFSHYKVYRNLLMIADDIMENSYIDLDVPNGTYSYNVRSVYSGGYQSALSTDAVIEHIQTNIDEIIIPVKTELTGNYPNPFNPTTTISFSTKEAGYVSINIYNMKGQLVKILVNKQLDAAYYDIVWNGKDNSDKPVSSGTYFYKMKSNNYTATKKMILMK